MEKLSVDIKDVERHAVYANEWWNPSGPMRLLHLMNEVRTVFVREELIAKSALRKSRPMENQRNILENLQILEVGCGGGIFTEDLAAKTHSNIVGIDPGEDVIRAAREHLEGFSSTLKNRITYKAETVEEHAVKNPNKYDAVVLSEVLEHIDNKEEFLSACLDTLKPGGSIFVTTFDKSLFCLVCCIWIAEYILRIVPAGTHQWKKFISPSNCQRILEKFNCEILSLRGFTYGVFSKNFYWISSTKSSYAMHAIKRETNQ